MLPLAIPWSPAKAESSHEVLRRLELTVTRKLDGLLQGDYRGLVPGHGRELGETREYQPGDDVRRIDWNVTARMQDAARPRDRSPTASSRRGCSSTSPPASTSAPPTARSATSPCGAAAVGFLTARTGNRIGAILLVRARHRSWYPLAPVAPHLQALLHHVITAPRKEGAGPTDLAAGLDRLGATMRRRGLAVVISDFLDPTEWAMPLRRLAVRHDLLAVEVVDPAS